MHTVFCNPHPGNRLGHIAPISAADTFGTQSLIKTPLVINMIKTNIVINALLIKPLGINKMLPDTHPFLGKRAVALPGGG